MFTMPTTPQGTAMVQPKLGVKINGIYYWADAFRDREIERTRIPVRYDPFDVGIAYALVKNRWVSCISECYADLQGRTEREVMLASQELRQQQRQHGQQFTVTAKKLAEFLTSVEAEEVLLQQRLRDAAGQAVLRLTSEPVSGQSDVNFPPTRKATVPENEAAVEPVAPVSDEWLNKTGETLTIYGDF
jgi:hypothetical protein